MTKRSTALFVPHCNDQRTLCAGCYQIVYDLSQSDAGLSALYERMENPSTLIVERRTPAPEVSWDDARSVPMDTDVEYCQVDATRMMLTTHTCHQATKNLEKCKRETAQELQEVFMQSLSQITNRDGRSPAWLESATTEALRDYVNDVDVANASSTTVRRAKDRALNSVEIEILTHCC